MPGVEVTYFMAFGVQLTPSQSLCALQTLGLPGNMEIVSCGAGPHKEDWLIMRDSFFPMESIESSEPLLLSNRGNVYAWNFLLLNTMTHLFQECGDALQAPGWFIGKSLQDVVSHNDA